MVQLNNDALFEAAVAIAHRGIFVRIAPDPAAKGAMLLQVRNGSRILQVKPTPYNGRALYEVFDESGQGLARSSLGVIVTVIAEHIGQSNLTTRHAGAHGLDNA